jgi:[acyl-carrier-protein] S-malonyltransferase
MQGQENMTKKRVVVVCPGRGSYTKETLGYLAHANNKSLLGYIDEQRKAQEQITISELDAMQSFKPMVHTLGENASTLIYACALSDFLSIDRNQYDIVAVTGNSMGWYLALACAGSLDHEGAYTVINTMGSMMKDELIGGQVLFSCVNEVWQKSAEAIEVLDRVLSAARFAEGVEIYKSINLGGSIVLGANKEGVQFLMKNLPASQNSPMTLLNHAAFHTPLMRSTSARAFELMRPSLFKKPAMPLIDGQGQIWSAYSTDLHKLYNYTLGTQVCDLYDFSKAIEVSLKEFAPDHIVLLGPGSNLGGAIAQIMIEHNWCGVNSKEVFTAMQAKNPFVLAMGRKDQRELLIKV